MAVTPSWTEQPVGRHPQTGAVIAHMLCSVRIGVGCVCRDELGGGWRIHPNSRLVADPRPATEAAGSFRLLTQLHFAQRRALSSRSASSMRR